MSLSLTDLLLIALGGGAGALARVGLASLVARLVAERFAFGTLSVNVSGAGAIGILAGLAADGGGAGSVWSFAAIGFLGGYTTVSSFALQSLVFARAGDFFRLAANVTLSPTLCLAACAGGYALAGALG